VKTFSLSLTEKQTVDLLRKILKPNRAGSCAQNAGRISCVVIDRSQTLSFQAVHFFKVLRFWQAGRSTPPRLLRINRGLPSGSTLAVKGEALNHRLHLVAWPVGSERRNHHLHQAVI
jgi:hypothetical protein